MTNQKKGIGGRREPPGGRPPKGNIRLVCYVQPETRRAIDAEAGRKGWTLGQVVDRVVTSVVTSGGEEPPEAGQ